MTGSPSRARLAAFLGEGPPALFLALLWLLWLGAIAWNERLPVNDGLGWDGSRFAKMAQAGPSMLFNHEINRYYVQRVGPSFAVRGLLALAGGELDDASVRWGFIALNLLLLSVALLLLMDAGKQLGLGPRGRLFLFLGLFANLPNARLPIYYAPIGDSSAFFLGSLIVWAFVTRRAVILLFAFVLAIVSWPAAFALLPVLVWPRPARGYATSSPADASSDFPAWSFVAALVIGAAILGVLWLAADMPPVEAWTRDVTLALGANALHVGASALAAVMMAWTARASVFQRPSRAGVMGLLILLVLSVSYVRAFESGSLSFSGQTYVREMLLFARSRAFTAIAGHGAYFGFLAMAAVFLWPRLLRQGLSLGAGGFVATALAGLMSIDAESRRLNATWPLVGLLAALVFERICRGARETALFAAAALLISKLWWPLGGPDLFTALHPPGNYFNTQGPSMSADAVAAHLAATALVGAAILLVTRRPQGHLLHRETGL